MHIDIDYSSTENRYIRDMRALNDVIEYLGEERWHVLVEFVQMPTTSIRHIQAAMAFAGIQGLPFCAMCRRYRLADYVAWMNSDTPEGKALPVDADGYVI